MRAVDANVLVRLVIGDDRRQVEAAEAFVAPGAWVSHLVLVETVWVLSSLYRANAGVVAEAIVMLLGNPTITIQDLAVVEAAVARFREQPAVSFADHLIIETARRAGHLPLGTFDRGLAKLEGAQGI